MLDEVFVYVDETVCEDRWGAGVLLSEVEIKHSLVQEALGNLSEDNDINNPETSKLDEKTLRNGHFHGSSDSVNARSHFSRSIKKHVDGLFFYSYDKIDPKLGTVEKNQREHSLLNLVGIFQGTFKIHIIFEERSGFSSFAAEKLIEDLYVYMDHGAYDFPTIPTFYSAVSVEVEGKDNPGLQVTDYLLWATNRAVLKEQPKFSNWLGIRDMDSARTVGGNDAWGRRAIGKGASRFENIDLNAVTIYPQQPLLETEHEYEVYELYIVAENFVHYFAKAGLPTHCQHFYKDFLRLSSQLRNDSNAPSLDNIRGIAKLFLRLLDTLPLHVKYPKESGEFEKLLRMKKFLGLTLRRDLIHGMNTAIALAHWRRELKVTHPDFLEKLLKGEAA